MFLRRATAATAAALVLLASQTTAHADRLAAQGDGIQLAAVKTEAELIYNACFRSKKNILAKYNKYRRYKAMVGGIRGPEGARTMDCFIVGNAANQTRATDKAMANCRKKNPKCFLAAKGILKQDWVRNVERRTGRTASLSYGGSPVTKTSSDAELLWRSCFVTGKDMVGRYNASRTNKALVAGIRVITGKQKGAKCFSTTKSKSVAAARDNGMRRCKEQYPKCYVVTEGGIKRKWVRDVEKKMGRRATVR